MTAMSQSTTRADGRTAVTVFGAYGHTGRFVVAELVERGLTPILSGRDARRLEQLSLLHGGLPVRPATVEDPALLDTAMIGASAMIGHPR